jgi:hypothetical protein
MPRRGGLPLEFAVAAARLTAAWTAFAIASRLTSYCSAAGNVLQMQHAYEQVNLCVAAGNYIEF